MDQLVITETVKPTDIDLDEIMKEAEAMAEFIKKRQMETLDAFIKTKVEEIERVYVATDPSVLQTLNDTVAEFKKTAKLLESESDVIEKIEKLFCGQQLMEE